MQRLNHNITYLSLQKDIVLIAANLLKVHKKHLGLEEDLSQLNLNSLVVTNLALVINKIFGINLTPANYYGHRTIGTLINYLYRSNQGRIDDYYNHQPLALTDASIAAIVAEQNIANEYAADKNELTAREKSDSSFAKVLKRQETERKYLIFLSANNKETLNRRAKQLLAFLNVNQVADKLLHNMERYLILEQELLNDRLGFVVENISELCEKLEMFADACGKSIGCYYEGSFNKYHGQISVFENRSVLERLFSPSDINQNLDKLAVLWVNGIRLDWSQLICWDTGEFSEEEKAKLSNMLTMDVV